MTHPRLLDPAEAAQARQQLADELFTQALPEWDRFLVEVQTDAVMALTSPVLMAAGQPGFEPFSLAGVRRRFARFTAAVGEVASALAATDVVERVWRAARGPLQGHENRRRASPTGEPSVTPAIDKLNVSMDPERWEQDLRRAAESTATAAFNQRQQVSAKQAQLGTKTWVAMLDEATRPSHREANGQQVPRNQPFTVGGEQLMFPGDPKGSPAQTYNCRCVTIYG